MLKGLFKRARAGTGSRHEYKQKKKNEQKLVIHMAITSSTLRLRLPSSNFQAVPEERAEKK